MTADDFEAFRRAAQALGEILPGENKPQTEDGWLMYFGALADDPLDAVLGAMRVAVRKLRWFPTPSELREILAGSPEDRAALAWARVYAHRGFGVYQRITFGDPVTHAAIEAMGGWSRIAALASRDVEGVDVATARKDFVHYFRIYEHRGAAGAPEALCDDERRLAFPGVERLTERPALPAAATRAALPAPTWEQMPADAHALVEGIVVAHQPPRRVVVEKPADVPPTDAERADLARRRVEALARFREHNEREAANG